MNRDLRERLERLERRRRPRQKLRDLRPLKPAGGSSSPRRSPRKAGALPAGDEVHTERGIAFRIETRYPGDQQHGKNSLTDLLSYGSELTAEVAGDQELKSVPLARLAFVDLETTGLVGGAGTIGFLVGVGAFDGDSFRLRQYFLRDPEEEPAMLEALREDLKAAEGVVSFNGRSFDLPLLQNRYTMALRERWRLTEFPHLDLLYPSRRLWKSTLVDCRLSTLERLVLEIERSEDDVSGELIPGMYLEYLRTGDASEMSRVIYHNAIDILSLVGLASRVLDRYGSADPAVLSSGEALAVARWHQAAGRSEKAEAAFRIALADQAVRREALRRLTMHLKRMERRHEALTHWKEWHKLDPADPAPCIELAMHYEWHSKELKTALKWSETALESLASWESGWRRDRMATAIEHRIARLRRKLRRD